jgi:hypothetical protein
VTAASRFGLVKTSKADGDSSAILDALIERQLQLIEVNRYAPPEPTDAEIAAKLAEVRARFDSQQAFDRALVETGLSAAQLRARLRDNLRIEGYLRQRFGSSFQPSDDEIVRYYRANEAAFTHDGVLRPFADVRDLARERLIADRSASLVRDWIDSLRRRMDVTILPR